MKSLSGLICGLVASVAMASSLPTSKPLDNPVAYSSMDEAAVAASTQAMQLSITNEYGGAVYLWDNQYYYTTAVTENRDDAVNYQVTLPKAAKIVAMYHTHPMKPYANMFSDADMMIGKHLKVTMYVGVVSRHHVIKYDYKVSTIYVEKNGLWTFMGYPHTMKLACARSNCN